jgi:hypothetical protein
MALIRGRHLLALATLGTLPPLACRELSVCEGQGTCALTTPGEGGADGAAGARGKADASAAGTSAETPAVASTEGGAAIADGGAMHAGAAFGGEAYGGYGGEESSVPSCELGTDDCDGSTLTVCETYITWDVQHCGACGQACDGICVLGHCKPSEPIQQAGHPRQFVTDSAFAYAIFDGEGAKNILRIELETGDSRVVGTGFSDKTLLAVSGDRLYALDTNLLRSKDLADGPFETEPFGAQGLGASLEGLYYTRISYDFQTKVATWSLWYRPTAASESSLLGEADQFDIIASGQNGVVVKRRIDAEITLLFASENRLTSLGPVPNFVSVRAVRNGVAMLVVNADEPSGFELWWTTITGGTTRFALAADVKPPAELVEAPGGVAMLLRERGSAFVQLFDDFGPSSIRLGLHYYSSLEFVDARNAWYTWRAADSGVPSFQRARQLEPTD